MAYLNVFDARDTIYMGPAFVYWENLGGGRSDYVHVPQSQGIHIVVKLHLLKGALAQLRDPSPEPPANGGGGPPTVSKRARTVAAALQGAAETPKLFFPGVVLPTDTRNDMYVTLIKGKFGQDRKRAAKNVAVRVYALNEKGASMRVLVQGTGPQTSLQSEYRSTVYYHNNEPEFRETLRIRIPEAAVTPADRARAKTRGFGASSADRYRARADELSKCHLLFVFFHASSNPKKTHPFAFTFLQLTNPEGVVEPDRDNVCPCFKPLKGMDHGPVTPVYLKEHDTGRLNKRGQKESFTVSTRLCSTQQTQQGVLHALMGWRHLPEATLVDVLRRITDITEERDVTLFFRHIFDVLVQLFASKHAGTEAVAQAVFHLFVHVLSARRQGVASGSVRADDWGAVLDVYLREIFVANPDAPRLYPVLLRQLKRLCDLEALDGNVDGRSYKTDKDMIGKTMKCFADVVHFVVASRVLDQERCAAARAAPGGGGSAANRCQLDDTEFRQECIIIHLVRR